MFSLQAQSRCEDSLSCFERDNPGNVSFQIKNMFHLRETPGGVLSGVSLGIKIHPPDPNSRHLLAFDCMNN